MSQESPRISLTRRVHEEATAHIRPGDWALDATAGNGHDTLFLAHAVGQGGRVFAMDVQAQALAVTRLRLDQANASARVDLLHAGHAELPTVLPAECFGKLAAILFNLGYLPGGDKTLITHTESTLHALDASLELLHKGGLLSVLAYPGHMGGLAEWQAVANWMCETSDRPGYKLRRIYGKAPPAGPELFLLTV